MERYENPGCGYTEYSRLQQLRQGDPGNAEGVIGIVLAGVHAWGENLLDEMVPRPLLPIADRPLIAHVLQWLSDAGVRQSTICANSGTSMVRRCLGRRACNVDLDYYEDVFPRGPAGCVMDAVGIRGAPFCVVVEGTLIPDIDLRALLAAHQESDAALTVVAARPEAAGADGPPGLKPLGIYVFSPAALRDVPPNGYQDIKEALIPRLYARGRRIALHLAPDTQVVRVTDAASYLAASGAALARLVEQNHPLDGYESVGESHVHGSARVHSTARLIGPVMVGPRSVIGSGSVVSGPTQLGLGCNVGRNVILSRSVVWDRCAFGDGAIVDQCLLTHDARVEPGLVVRNSIYAATLPQLDFWARLASRWRGWHEPSDESTGRPHEPFGFESTPPSPRGLES